MFHEKLNCYSLLLDFAKRLPDLVRKLPRYEYHIIDQLKRALESSILNLAEGNAKTSIKDRNKFFDISLGSLAEVASAFDVITVYGHISNEMNDELKSKLRLIYVMIRRLKR